jgi:hypothetical protein
VRGRKRLVAAAAIAIAANVSAGETSWVSARNGSWSVGANWVDGTPVAGDSAIVSSGVGTVDQNFNLNNFSFTGGEIRGGNSISTSGSFTWSGSARLGGSGTLSSNGTLAISGAVYLDGRTINNAATGIWSAGDLQPHTNNTTLNNLAGATLFIRSNNNVDSFNGATLTLNNAGTMVKDSSAGTSFLFDARINNTGTIDVQTGTLALGFFGGTSSGNFNIASGVVLAFGYYTFHPGTTFTGAGTIRIGIGAGSPTGTAMVNTDLSASNVALTSTTTAIDGSARLSISQRFDWQKGDLLGTGTMQINSNGTMNMSAGVGQTHSLFRNIDNNGVANWSSTAIVETGRGAMINNAGTWNFTADQQLQRPTALNGPAMLINNTGTISKSAGTGSTSIEASITNNGALTVSSGVLELALGGRSENGSTINIAAGGTLRLAGGAFGIKNGTSITNNGTLENSLGSVRASSTTLSGAKLMMNGLELAIDGNLDDNQFTWSRGVLSGSGTTTLTSDHTFDQPWGIAGGRALDTDGHNITWSDGFFGYGGGDSAFGFSGGGTINNSAGSIFAINLSSGTFDMGVTSDPLTLNNSGTLSKSGDAAIRILGALNNSGAIQVNDGALIASGGGSNSGRFAGTGTLVLGGPTQTFTSGSTISSLNVTVQADAATLGNSAPGAYQMQQLIVGEPANDARNAKLTIPSGVVVSTGSLTILAGSTLSVDGGGITSTGSAVVDQVAFGNEDAGVFVTNNGTISAGTISVQHATLDVDSGTITASNRFQIDGGTASFHSGAHLIAPTLDLNGGDVNAYQGFAWPASSLSTNGTTIHLKSGVSYSFAGSSNIAHGGLIIEPGASLDVGSMLHGGNSEIRGGLTSSGSVSLQFGSVFTVSMPGTVSAQSIGGDGLLYLSSGIITTGAGSGTFFTPNGGLVGTGMINGNVQCSGFIVPGEPSGDLHISGNLTLNGLTSYVAQIDASSAIPQVGHITVDGAAQLGGSMQVSFDDDNFVLLPNQTLELIHFTSRTGTFSSLFYSTPYEGLSYTLVYASGNVSITGQALPGDANLDGVVNAIDFDILATNFSASGTNNWLAGDFSGDGSVNSSDFTLLAANFNSRLPGLSLPLGALSPEPTCSSILTTTALLFFSRRRRRNV